MSKWKALRIMMQYISREWDDVFLNPLTPFWFAFLMDLAELAHKDKWTQERIEKEMEDARV